MSVAALCSVVPFGDNAGPRHRDATTVAAADPMTVHCPHCKTGYLLPDHLLGAHGSRVRCPECGETFVVTREGAAPEAPPAPLESSPAAVAAEMLDALAAELGPKLTAARERGRVLSDLGPDLLGVWDAYRERLGPQASAEVFRAVLRERWDVTLR